MACGQLYQYAHETQINKIPSLLFFLKEVGGLLKGGFAMKRLIVAVFVFFILLLWKIPMVSAQTQFVEAGVEKFRIPVEAPDFTLTDVDGKKVSLKELRGKIIILNFFASW